MKKKKERKREEFVDFDELSPRDQERLVEKIQGKVWIKDIFVLLGRKIKNIMKKKLKVP